MNQHDDPTDPMPVLDDRLAGALHRRLDGVGAHEDLVAGVVARSHRIRRTRRVATASATTLAVLALATPIAWSNLRGDQAPVLPATSTGTPTEVSSSTPTTTTPVPTSTSVTTTTLAPTTGVTSSGAGPAPTALPAPGVTTSRPGAPAIVTHDNTRPARRSVTLSGVPAAGAVPATVWRSGSTLHADGASTVLDAPTPWSWTSLSSTTGVVAEADWAAGGKVRIVRTDGTEVATVVTVPPRHVATVRASADGRRFAVLVRSTEGGPADATLTAFDATGTKIAGKDNLLRSVRLAGFAGGRVFLGNADVGRSYVWNLRTNVIDRYTDSGVITAVDDRHELAALWTRTKDYSPGCTDVADVTGSTAVVTARSCGWFMPTGFSPDGTKLVGYDVRGDSQFLVTVLVLDIASGRLDLSVDGNGYWDPTFVSGGAIGFSFITYPGNQEVLVSCTIGGRCTRFTDPVTAPDDGNLHYGLGH